MNEVVLAEDLGKQFARYHTRRPRTMQEWFLSGFRRARPLEHFWALRDASFAVAPGEMLGVIGSNGSGKSTLLQLIGGVLAPDAGRIQVHGAISGLLELGAGFHPDLTGRENVLISGVVAGLTRREVAQRFDDILEFAELEDSIDNPLRTYSSGMRMRLGFSVAVHTEPHLLLIDEALSVGDLAFQEKCLGRIDQFRSQGCAIVFVSHDLGQVQQLCEKVLWLRSGRVAAYGDAEVVAGQYTAEMSAETRRRTPFRAADRQTAGGALLQVNENRFGSLEMEIMNVTLLDQQENPVSELQGGTPLCIEIEYEAPELITSPHFSVSISNRAGDVCFDTSTDAEGVELPRLHGSGRISLYLDRVDLTAGSYFVDVGVYERGWAYAYDYHWHVYPLLVEGHQPGKGFLAPPRRWRIGQSEPAIQVQGRPVSRRQ